VSPVRYELSYYIPEDDILHSHSRENLKSLLNPFHSSEVESSYIKISGNGPNRTKASTSISAVDDKLNITS
jgi:hypothetical protein